MIPNRTLRFSLACVALLAAAGHRSPARAGDTWSTPHPGVSLLRRTTSTPWRIHALQVDLCARGVSVAATAESERRQTPSAFRSDVGAQAAINGDFFSYSTYLPSGLAVGDGALWHDDNGWEGYVAFGPDHATLSPPTDVLGARPGWMREAVGGWPLLVKNGRALTSFSPAPSHCPDRHPRSAVGLSRDRQHLFLVVVDGRSTSSVGMTCRELAQLMEELGAWTALNLDGGGSSALSVAGIGTVNSPSDGSERVVANHLAIFADGTGAPGACDLWLDEVVVDAAALEAATTTDVDGDGRADLCARGASGLRCYPSTGDGFAGPWLLEELSDEHGWTDETNFATLRMGDVNGDGLADVCARGNATFFCWPSTGSGFGARIDGPALSDADGWDAPEYWATLRLADFDGDGRDDLCGRDAAGWFCRPSTGTGFGPAVRGPAWSDDSGWAHPRYYGTIRTGDVDGDGRADVCARASAGMRCALSQGTGFGGTLTGPEWSNAAGWDDVSHWSTIRLVDVDGDGRADLCGRGPEGLDCHLSTGSGFGPAVPGPALSDDQGWGDMDNSATLRFGDLDGDGDLDACARANAGMRCWPWTGAGFGAQLVGPAWDGAAGFDDFRHYATIHLGDLDGDGRADLCARRPEGVRCHLSTGGGFGPELDGPSLADSGGWHALPYFSTLRFGGPAAPRCRPTDEICGNGVDDDCNGEVDEPEDCPATQDGGTGAPDAGGDDAGGGAPDGGPPPGEDGGAGVADGGAPLPDAGAGDAGPIYGPDVVGGCGCSGASGAGGPAALLAILIFAVRRRRA